MTAEDSGTSGEIPGNADEQLSVPDADTPGSQSSVGEGLPADAANLSLTVSAPTETTAEEPSRSRSPKRAFSLLFLLGVIGLVGLIFYWVMARFLIPLFLAALLVVIFRPLHRWILDRTGRREQLSAVLTTLAILLAVLVPLALLIVMAAAESRDVFRQFSSAKLLNDFQTARAKLNLDLPSAGEVRDIDQRLINLALTDLVEPDQVKRHGADLFEIAQSAELIAQGQSLPSPEEAAANAIPESLPGASSEDGDQEPDAAIASGGLQDRESRWGQFCVDLQKLKSLYQQISDSGQSSRFNELLHDYREQTNATIDTFDVFKYDLLGGKTRAFAIELLNPDEEKIGQYASKGRLFLQEQVVKFGGVAGSILGSLILGSTIMIISLYFFLLDGPAMMSSLQGLSPLDDEHEQELAVEFAKVSRAVVVATLLSALAQGILAGIGFYFCGLEAIFLLTLLSAVLAMVPFVGAAAVWVPCCLYLYFVQNEVGLAIGLAVYGVAVISMVDNFIKPWVLHGQSNLHPLLALLSVIGGVTALGPIGILIGPMVVVFLQTLLKILQRELLVMEGPEVPES